MDGPELSRQEQRILGDIEENLRADQLLDRRLRTLHRGIRPWASTRDWYRHHGLGLCTGLLGITCAALFVRAVSAPSPALIWAFAAAWVLTLIPLLLLVIRWCRKAAAASAGRKKG
ncbi:DUF3040 domain-containing protein [Streptomyces sp. ISL-66]|uniref:DUF3040 domain-containing protein n=1 Tax=Streptomyces sp. ISL-66 TaxID=2819186 RepID=UPI001BE86E5B|nr:DUF3040 domain-containing protein [Streptomyces sp. ISL-66]MBT2471562.1 DUF3040 domain-containing protein [Streptomyces sp. ISL-66]